MIPLIGLLLAIYCACHLLLLAVHTAFLEGSGTDTRGLRLVAAFVLAGGAAACAGIGGLLLLSGLV